MSSGKHCLRRLVLISVLGLVVALGVLSPAAYARSLGTQDVVTPQSYLGFVPGEDRCLADWDQIKEYFRMVDEASDRVVVEDIGPTTLGDRMIMAIVSSPDTIARLEHYKAVQRKLADPRGLTQAEIAALTAEAKTVVMVAASIHSTEIGGTQASINVLHNMAASQDPVIQEILDNTILLLIPSLNPDGHRMVVDWYREHLGTPFEGTSQPWLYHEYVGHDNNRDWFMFNLTESRNVGKVLYHDWFPEIVYDIHQMGSTGARLFVPPFFDPPNPQIDPIILREIMLLGGAATTDLAAKGFKGVSSNAQYDTWWHGGMRSGPYYHNMVGLLTEAASVNIATPIEVPFEKLTTSTRGLPNAQGILTNFPDVWPGGTWRLADIVAYEETVIYAFLKTAARFRDTFVNNFVLMGNRAVERGLNESPFAFILPADQRDPGSLSWMLEVLMFQGMEVHRALRPFVADGVTYPAGTYVILTSQPYRSNVLALLDRQTYPERREYPGGPAERPYDIAGWTLPMQMGVECVKVSSPFSVDLIKLESVSSPAGSVVAGDASYGYAFRPEANAATIVRNRLLQSGMSVLRADEPFACCGYVLPPGTTIVLAAPGLEGTVRALAEEFPMVFYPVGSEPHIAKARLSLPRLAVYEQWGGNMDAGWTRLVLEQFGFSYTHLRDAEVRAGNLAAKYDVIILPDSTLAAMRDGLKPGTYPEEYTGGMTAQGLANLKQFVESGGTLVTFDTAGDFAIEVLGVAVKDGLKGVSTKEFYCPGSILEIDIDNNHPVTYGMDIKAGAYFVHSPAYVPAEGVRVLASYPKDTDPLMSGWLMGSQFVQGKAALVEAEVGDGRVIMIGFRVQHRGQPHGTYKLLFNSIFYGASEPVK
ncbi:MAG: M14 family zinc carboxypeptidase [Firmicutes bacterium]|jgi:hypothetical protein|nr:M14 family zinc carboxypeptidase [Bacillota bacterium]